MADRGFVEIMSKRLSAELAENGQSKLADTLLSALIELRESALKNNDSKTYEYIASTLASKGIRLSEEKRIIVNTSVE